jgi:hypothetical protein
MSSGHGVDLFATAGSNVLSNSATSPASALPSLSDWPRSFRVRRWKGDPRVGGEVDPMQKPIVVRGVTYEYHDLDLSHGEIEDVLVIKDENRSTLFRALGVVMFLLGIHAVLGPAIWYFALLDVRSPRFPFCRKSVHHLGCTSFHKRCPICLLQ